MMVKNILILGGTAEAATIAERLAGGNYHVITSLAGRTRAPRAVAGEVRIGGFGGVAAMTDYLRDQRIDRLIDATHPFATQISAHAVAACDGAGVKRLQLVRPAWQGTADDNWIEVEDGRAAARALRDGGYTRAFLATGRQELPAFGQMPGVWFLVRLVDQPDQPLALMDYDVVTGRGPFVEAEERALLADRRIDVIVAKNAGGAGSWPKMAAARELGLPVIMIRRAVAPDGDHATSVEDVLEWMSKRV
jgi:precorrin-6A/cobalt-precorrin-6A reductase